MSSWLLEVLEVPLGKGALFAETLQLEARGCGQEAFALLRHPQARGGCCAGCIRTAWIQLLPKITAWGRREVHVSSQVVLVVS